jgi:hypothetical protein
MVQKASQSKMSLEWILEMKEKKKDAKVGGGYSVSGLLALCEGILYIVNMSHFSRKL